MRIKGKITSSDDANGVGPVTWLIRFAKWLAVVLAVLIAGFVFFVFARADRTYEAPYPDIVASADPTVIARGKHLFYATAHCTGCHAPRNELARLEAGEEVLPSGGEDFDLPLGMIYAPNITPDVETGIGAYTDQELARAMRFGVKRNGQALMDFMPFYDLSDQDLTAIISFLRTLPPVRNERPENDWNFLGKALLALEVLKPQGDEVAPEAVETEPTKEYGRYLAESLANCRGCHTKRNIRTGEWSGPDYSGQAAVGVFYEGVLDTSRHIITPNLTPDPETGRITEWSQQTFIQRFRAGRTIPESIMPWASFKKMTDLELTALYKFFQSLPAVRAEKPIPIGVQEGPPPWD